MPLTRQHLENRYGNKTWPKLLILQEKHDPGYFLINDIDALLRAAVKVVTERHKERWYYQPEEPKLKEEVPDDVMDRLPEALRKKAKDDKHSNKSNMKRYQKALDLWNLIQKAVTEQDGMAAFQVLDDRKDHEYENWHLEDIEIP